MADDLARFNAAPEPELTMSDGERHRLFQTLHRSLSTCTTYVSAAKASEYMEREIRHSITFVVEQINDANLPAHQQEIISEHLFRRLGDLSSAIDNQRTIALDILSTDIHRILERHKGSN